VDLLKIRTTTSTQLIENKKRTLTNKFASGAIQLLMEAAKVSHAVLRAAIEQGNYFKSSNFYFTIFVKLDRNL
jgi:hypothetical protein